MMATAKTTKTTAAKAAPQAATRVTTEGRHRLVKLRRYTGECSCGRTYVSEGEREEVSADVREQHREHKLNPVPAKPVRKPRARKATAK